MTETETIKRPKPGEIIEGRVIDLAYGGAGVVKLDKWVIMVRGAFPGDLIRILIRRKRKGIIEGDLLEVIEPTEDRIEAPCPHLCVCGGCALQGLAPAAQTRYKADQALQLLRRIGKFEPLEIAKPWQSPDHYYYRNKMEFTFAPRPWLTKAEMDAGIPFGPGPALGLHPRGCFQGVFNITDCHLQSVISNKIVIEARALAQTMKLPVYNSHQDEGLLRHLVIRQSATTKDLLVVLVVREEDSRLEQFIRELAAAVPEITGIILSVNLRRSTVALGDYDQTVLGESYWHEQIMDINYRIGASSFFQTQTLGGLALLEEALEVGGFDPGDRVLDLYCGIGAFSLPIARRVKKLLGVEVLPAAVEEARYNAGVNKITNAEFIAAPVETREKQSWEAPESDKEESAGKQGENVWDVIVIDPPRAGLHPKALAKVQAIAPPKIVYVSCNPSTLARDAGILVEENGYVAKRLRVFDIFPQTPHLESVLLLEK